MFDTCEVFHIGKSLSYFPAVFDVDHVVLNSGVENVGEAIFPEEDEGHYPDALADSIGFVLMSPDLFEVVDRVDLSLMSFYICE